MEHGGQKGAASPGELAELVVAERRWLGEAYPCDGSRCDELVAHEGTLAWLLERLRQEVKEGARRFSGPLDAVRAAADTLRFEVPPSHRGAAGRPVTAAKKLFIQGLRPFHVELLRPQHAFNLEVVRVIEQLAQQQRSGDTSGLARGLEERLTSLADPAAWSIRPARPKATGRAVAATKRAYFGALGGRFRALLERQAAFNRLLVETLAEAGRGAAQGTADAAARIARLEGLMDPLGGESPAGGPLTPLWREVFRRQHTFNREAMLAAAHLLGTHPPASATPTGEAYPEWYARVEPAQVERAARALESLEHRPLVSIAVPVYRTPGPILRTCIDSVLAQSYENWELCLADDGSGSPELTALLEEYARRDARIRFRTLPANVGIARATNAALEDCRGELVAFLDHDDALAPHALAESVLRFAEEPELDWVYSDEDRMNAEGERCNPFFKPDFSPELLRGCNYICHFVVVRRALVQELGGIRAGYEGSQDYDFVLRLSERSTRVGHIPRILYHWRHSPISLSADTQKLAAASRAGRKALEEHLARLGEPAEVVDDGKTSYRVRHPVRGEPLVSIIVPFKDKPELLETLVSSLLAHTRYARFELLLVSNQSVQPETHALLARLTDARIRVLHWDEPFNYPAINNFAARHAKGELLLFLNNDMEVTEPGWLEELVGQAQRPEVGAVAPKLLFPDGSVQHVGVVVGLGGFAGHPFWRMPDGQTWTAFGHADWPRNYLAVTSACVMVRRELFESLGGFDERFRVCHGDIELCLRMVSRGLRVVYTPYTRLTHHESASRRLDAIPEDDWWNAFVAYRRYLRDGDPFYNPNLTLLDTRCGLRGHAEDGEQLALRTLAHELPGSRDPGPARNARYRAHVADHLKALSTGQPPPPLATGTGAPRRIQWFLQAFRWVPAELGPVFALAGALARQHGVQSEFVVVDAWGDALRAMEVQAQLWGAEGTFRGLPGRDALAGLGACDVAVATTWSTAYAVQEHPAARLRASLVQDFEPARFAAGTEYAMAEQTYRFGLVGLFRTEALHALVTRSYPLQGHWFEPAVNPEFLASGTPRASSRGPMRLLCLAHPASPASAFELALPVLRSVKQELGDGLDIVVPGAPFSPAALGLGELLSSQRTLTPGELARLLRESDVALGFSLGRTPAQSVLEAMASGVAVVTNDNPALHGLLRHGENCLAAEPTETALGTQLRKALGGAPLRQRLAAEARRSVAALTVEAQADRVYQALLALLGEESARRAAG